jgi:hypothetical protein
VTQSQPASSMKPAAFFDVISWNAVCLLAPNPSHPSRRLVVEAVEGFYQRFERLFKSSAFSRPAGGRTARSPTR